MPDNPSSETNKPTDQKPEQPVETRPEASVAKKNSRNNPRKRTSKPNNTGDQNDDDTKATGSGRVSSDDRKTDQLSGGGETQTPKKNVRGSRAKRHRPPDQEQKDKDSETEKGSVVDPDNDGETSDEKGIHNRESSRGHQNKNRTPNQQKVLLDPEKVSKKSWKIFLAEVSEEGVALINDNDARELSRRCFRLAELFLEEEQRRNRID